MKANVEEGKLKVEWLDKAWEEWAELQKSPGLRSLSELADEKLAKSVGSGGKGKGKKNANTTQQAHCNAMGVTCFPTQVTAAAQCYVTNLAIFYCDGDCIVQ